MTYSAPELALVGTAQSIVLENSTFAGNTKELCGAELEPSSDIYDLAELW